jgi:hypothetical protein
MYSGAGTPSPSPDANLKAPRAARGDSEQALAGDDKNIAFLRSPAAST